jgi:hypothetical protein
VTDKTTISSPLWSASRVGERVLRLGSRPSQLARWQTDFAAAALHSAWPGLQTEVAVYTTKGDRELNRPLPEIGGKGLFTAEIEAALRSDDIDLAVHSFKDLPIVESEGLAIGAILKRADARDVLVSRHGLPLEGLPPRPRIGTSSPRRAAQLLAARPDAHILPIRGNVDTRLRKAATDDYDAVVLAAAGLIRLGLEAHITQQLPKVHWRSSAERMTKQPWPCCAAYTTNRPGQRSLPSVPFLAVWEAAARHRWLPTPPRMIPDSNYAGWWPAWTGVRYCTSAGMGHCKSRKV